MYKFDDHSNITNYSYGIVLCTIIAFFSPLIALFIPVGAVTVAIVVGIIIGNSFVFNPSFYKDISFIEKYILSIEISLMGINLNFTILKHLGFKTILLVIFAVILTISLSFLISKVFKLNTKLAILLGIGSAICGSSAIAASEKIVGASKQDVGLSIAVVNFLGALGIFLLPFLAKFFLNLSEENSGVLIGNTLQAVGQVVAAGFSVSEFTGQIATVVKMTRILMLFPLVFLLIYLFLKSDKNRKVPEVKGPKFPLFIFGFILFSLISSFNIFTPTLVEITKSISHSLLLVIMAAVGIRISIVSMLKTGKAALLAGSLLFFIQIIFSSMIIYFFF